MQDWKSAGIPTESLKVTLEFWWISYWISSLLSLESNYAKSAEFTFLGNSKVALNSTLELRRLFVKLRSNSENSLSYRKCKFFTFCTIRFTWCKPKIYRSFQDFSKKSFSSLAFLNNYRKGFKWRKSRFKEIRMCPPLVEQKYFLRLNFSF